jgi:sortase A
MIDARRFAVFNWLVGAALMALYCGVSAYQEVARSNGILRFESLRQLNQETLAAPDQSLWSAQRIADYENRANEERGVPEALLTIRSVDIQVPVYPGTGGSQLSVGAGHIEGTAAPGSGGNVGIAAHRDGFFRGLKDIRIGDEIEVETLAGIHRYEVVETAIVEPTDVHVLADTGSPALTLITCYPFYFAGNAPQRFVVRAHPLRA